MRVYDYSSARPEHTRTLYFEVEDIDSVQPVDPADYETPQTDLYALVFDA